MRSEVAERLEADSIGERLRRSEAVRFVILVRATCAYESPLGEEWCGCDGSLQLLDRAG